MTIVRLTSRENALLKTIRLVSSQARRAPADLVVAEGLRSLEELTGAERNIEAVLVSDSFGATPRENSLLDVWASRGVKLCCAPDSLLAGLSDVLAPQGAIALVRLPQRNLRDVQPARNPLILCACGLQDPGNLGTLIRAATAAAASMICTTPGTVSARNPKAIRASAGTCFRLPVIERVSPGELLAYCDERGIRVYGTGARAGMPYSKVDFRVPAAILLGNEAKGISQEEWGTIPSIHIPMAMGVESLNVAAAGAILLFEAYRQRSAAQDPSRRDPKIQRPQ